MTSTPQGASPSKRRRLTLSQCGESLIVSWQVVKYKPS